MARSTSSRLHLAPKNMSRLLDSSVNPDLGADPVTVMKRLKCDFIPTLEPVFDSRGVALEGLNNIVGPEGRSLGTSGDRFRPLGMPKLAEMAGKLIESVPGTRMLAGWQVGNARKYGYRLSVGESRAVANRGDIMGLFLDITGGNDCGTTWGIQGSVIRLACTNGMTASESLSTTFGRHTINADIKITDAVINAVMAINDKGLSLVSDIAALASKPMSELQIRSFLQAFAARREPKNEDRAKQLVSDLIRLMGSETQQLAMTNGVATAYTLYNAITEYNTYAGARNYETAFLNNIAGNNIESNAVAYEMLAA